jgi:hypothetical protein
MSAFELFAHTDLEALSDLAQSQSNDALAPTVVLVNDSDPFETHLALVVVCFDELRRSYYGNGMDIDPQVIALGDALHGLASVALDNLLSLRDEPALSVLEALQWVSLTPCTTIYTFK